MSKKEKKLNFSVVEREHEPELYKMLDGLVRKHHTDLRDARIVLAWRFGWSADVDGRLTLGQMKKASDLDRKLHGYDFVVLLNFEAWTAAEFTDDQKRALLDHELCHGALALDEDGETQHDVEGHNVYRTRKHDLEEFVEVVRRHGLWRTDLENFAEAAMATKRHPLLAEQDDLAGRVVARLQDEIAAGEGAAVEKLRPKKGTGIDKVTLSSGGRTVTLEAR